MIIYAKFLFKRLLCRKSNIFVVILSILLLSGILLMNMRSQDELRKTFDIQIETNQLEIKKYENKIANEPSDSKKRSEYEAQIDFLESNSQAYENMIDYYDTEDWSQFYNSYINVLEDQINIIVPTSDEQSSKNINPMSNYYAEQLVYIKYLNEHNLVYEEKSFPVFGLSFLTYVTKGISPIIILICCIYILAQLFTIDYKKDINIHLLYPISRVEKFLIRIFVGIFTSSIIYLLILLCTFLVATLITGNTGFEFPVMIQDSITKEWHAISSIAFLKEWFIIGALFYLSICFFTYSISAFIKEDGTLFLTTICMILGIAYLPSGLESLRSISHFLPTTYMNFIKVASGELAIEYSNISINLYTGIVVLIIFAILLFIFCIIKEQMNKTSNRKTR